MTENDDAGTAQLEDELRAIACRELAPDASADARRRVAASLRRVAAWVAPAALYQDRDDGRSLCGRGLHDLNDPANVYRLKAGGRRCKPCTNENRRVRRTAAGGSTR